MKFIKILLVIILLASTLIPRFWKLGELPSGTHVDEPSFAIEAQSLVDNGYDSWGVRWPAYFEAYGEYKAPGLIYSYIPFIHLLGHTNTVVSRLPSAILGLGTLFVTYLIIRLIYPSLSLISSILSLTVLAFSPWFFGTSRVYFETNGGLFFVALGFYALLKYLYKNKNHYLILAAASMAISGYWYASYRYITILLIILFAFLSFRNLRKSIKPIGIILVVYTLFASGWLYYLLSSEGLKRLSHYQEITRFGATLVVDEKRAYCFLSFDRDPQKTKLCYALWNKPVEKVTAVATTFIRYLSPEFLFFDSNQEYGVDVDYGAYLYPVLLLYIIGLYTLLRTLDPTLLKLINRRSLSATEQSQLLILAITAAGFATASLTQQVNLHRATVGIWGVYLIMVVGIAHLRDWIINHQYKKALSLLLFAFILINIFYTLQSQINYFFVYTRSNDAAWRSDMGSIYQQLREIESKYDRIVDTVYMGPIDASFYGLLPTHELAKSERTPRNPEGWSYVSRAGKYEMSRHGIEHYICEKIKNPDSTKVLVITQYQHDINEVAIFSTRSWDGVHPMHDLYDVDTVIEHQIKQGIDLNRKCK